MFINLIMSKSWPLSPSELTWAKLGSTQIKFESWLTSIISELPGTYSKYAYVSGFLFGMVWVTSWIHP